MRKRILRHLNQRSEMLSGISHDLRTPLTRIKLQLAVIKDKSLSEKISKISQDEKLRRYIGKNGKEKYLKYFNSNLVAEFIINKTLNIKSKSKYIWHKN